MTEKEDMMTDDTEIRVSVRNDSSQGGTFLTPFWFGFHDGSFDLFEIGQSASAGLEQIAEDGDAAGLGAELTAVDADGRGGVALGAAGVIAPGEVASATVSVDGASNGQVSLASMVIPSNDAFIGTDQSITLFDENGVFRGAHLVEFTGDDVLDAGTEVNTETDAAFLNQTAPNTGEDENGVIGAHPGFNGSVGNPGGEALILGGENGMGVAFDEVAADFTRPGAGVATVHINAVARFEGGEGRDVLRGGAEDDLVEAGGGNDVIFGNGGWDVISGGEGGDILRGGAGLDIISGGGGDDIIRGDAGGDVLRGGAGDDRVIGGGGDDVFLFSTGDETDRIVGFDASGGDVISLSVEGVSDFDGVLGAARSFGPHVRLEFSESDVVILRNVDIDDLTAAEFIFA